MDVVGQGLGRVWEWCFEPKKPNKLEASSSSAAGPSKLGYAWELARLAAGALVACVACGEKQGTHFPNSSRRS